ncbi:MAG: CPBP family intramembrane glutamic endopeptidase [Verrucomicrobiae bacterium]|nr:CPBP family intramembrane glutamic endopeptidase [Verrucomicrobiae bacterium]
MDPQFISDPLIIRVTSLLLVLCLCAGGVFFFGYFLPGKIPLTLSRQTPLNFDLSAAEFLTILAALLMASFSLDMAVTLAAFSPGFDWLRGSESARVLFQGSLFQLATIGLLVLFLHLKSPANPVSAVVGLPPRQWLRQAGLGVFLMLVAWPFVAISAGLNYRLFQWLGGQPELQRMVTLFLESRDPAFTVGIFLMATVMAPIWEEIFFRGITYTALKKYLSPVGSLLISSLLFSILHDFSLQTLLPLWLLGMVFAFAYERTGSILVPIFMHATFNSLSMGFMLLYKFTHP